MDYSDNSTAPFVGNASPGKPIEDQTRDQIGPRQVRVTIDERNLQANYVSGFRSTVTDEEVILDFGLNLVRPMGDKDHPAELVFQANSRLILNYYNAKRLAIALGQIVRQFEQRFGGIELDAAKRRLDRIPQPSPQDH